MTDYRERRGHSDQGAMLDNRERRGHSDQRDNDRLQGEKGT